MKKSKFNGQIRLWNNLVFGTLADGASVIIADSVANAKALIGCMVEYQPEKINGKVLNRVKGIELVA